MGTRQKSDIQKRETSDRLTTGTSRETTNNTAFVLKSKENSSEVASKGVPLFTEPLTPLHRLRRFKAIRDRNLRTSNRVKRVADKYKMSVDNDVLEEVGSRKIKEMKAKKEKQEKVNNGNHDNDEKINDDNLEGKKTLSKDENTEVNGSPKENTSSVSEPKAISLKSDVKKNISDTKETQHKKQEDHVSDPLDVYDFKLVEDNLEDFIISNDDDDDQNNEVKSSNASGNVENDEHRESDHEQFLDEEPREKVKILRRSYRQQLLRAQPSTSKQDNVIVEKPREKHSSSLSPETVRRMKSSRVEGRRSLYLSQESYRKRKYGDYFNGSSEVDEKKQALNSSTPSVASPGWKFISSPFRRFLTPAPDTPDVVTPYKSLLSNDNEDSLAVNVDDKSLYNKLNDSELDMLDDDDTNSTSSNWRCNIM